jgi:bifunctional non-homologous end joining protein LigD
VISGAFDVPVERAILDGEIVVVKDGRTSFSELQAELAKGNQTACCSMRSTSCTWRALI